jgi:hypothetical protein
VSFELPKKFFFLPLPGVGESIAAERLPVELEARDLSAASKEARTRGLGAGMILQEMCRVGIGNYPFPKTAGKMILGDAVPTGSKQVSEQGLEGYECAGDDLRDR